MFARSRSQIQCRWWPRALAPFWPPRVVFYQGSWWLKEWLCWWPEMKPIFLTFYPNLFLSVLQTPYPFCIFSIFSLCVLAWNLKVSYRDCTLIRSWFVSYRWHRCHLSYWKPSCFSKMKEDSIWVAIHWWACVFFEVRLRLLQFICDHWEIA